MKMSCVSVLLLLVVVVANGNVDLYMNSTETKRLLGELISTQSTFILYLFKLCFQFNFTIQERYNTRCGCGENDATVLNVCVYITSQILQ